MKWPIAISKAYMNPQSRRKGNNGKQSWRVYGYDEDFHFITERIKGNILGMKPKMKLYYKRTGNCIHCGRHLSRIVADKHDDIICNKCIMESP